MQEFSSVTASSYDADSLAPLLTEKSAEGWTVVSIVAAGTNIVAYLERESDGAAPAAEPVDTTDVAVADDAADAAAGVPAAAAVAAAATDTATETAADTGDTAADEPAGWASAPESTETDTATETADESLAGLVADVEAAETAEATPTLADTGAAAAATAAAEPAAEAAAEPAATAPAAESTVPAGWYADPSGRFELRYWDGTAWTEHVSRAGQQFTDPPVA